MLSNRKRRGKKLMSIVALAMTIVLATASNGLVVGAASTPALYVDGSWNLFVGSEININIENKISGSEYSWSSSNKSIAAVNSRGFVTGEKEGSATITCKVKAPKKTYTLNRKVTVQPAANGVEINNKIDSMLIGTKYNLNRTLDPEDSKEKTKWQSSDKDIADLDSRGKFLAKKAGTVDITAITSSGKTDKVTINVTDAVTVTTQEELNTALSNEYLAKITLESSSSTGFVIPQGKNFKADLIVNTPNADVENSSRFKSITVKAIKSNTWTEKGIGNTINMEAPNGKLIVTPEARLNKVNATGKILNISADGILNSVIVKGATTVNLSGKAKNTSLVLNTENATITTSMPLTILAYEKGNLIFQLGSEGSMITNETEQNLNIDNRTGTPIEIIGQEAEPPENNNDGGSSSGSSRVSVSGVSLDKDTMEVGVGTMEKLTASITPSNATNKRMTWTSSNENVAIVNDAGNVTGISVGTATITVKTEDGNKTDTCTIEVKQLPNNPPTVKKDSENQTGKAAPKSADGRTAAVSYVGNASLWFEDKEIADNLAYKLISIKEGENDLPASRVQITGDTINYTPDAADAGKKVTIVIAANDGKVDSTGNVTITVDVGAVPADMENAAPTVKTGMGSQKGDAAPSSKDNKINAVPYQGLAKDWFEDKNTGDTLTYGLVSALEGANDVSSRVTVDPSAGTVTYTPIPEDAGKSVKIIVKANDGTVDSTANVTITVTVKAIPNSVPAVKANQNTQTGDATPESADKKTPVSPYTHDLSEWFEDADTDTLTYKIVSAKIGEVDVKNIKIEAGTNNVIYTPDASEAEQTVTILIKANDGKADSDDAVTITVTVNAIPPGTASAKR